MRVYGWCHNGYHDLPAAEVLRRARRAGLDALIIKWGDPAFEREISAQRCPWGTERFAYAADAAGEGRRLADAVDAGASFAVANCEPNDGGGWGGEDAASAARALIDAFRSRHAAVPLYFCADLRRGRSLDAPFVLEAARGGIDGWMPMVYPGAFAQSVTAAFDAAYPGPAYLRLPCAPVLQTYGNGDPRSVAEAMGEAIRRGARGASIYLVETATGAELDAVARARATTQDAATLIDLAIAYRAGAIAILDRGTPGALARWGARWAIDETSATDAPPPPPPAARLEYLRGALAILDHGTPRELQSWGERFAR